MDESGRRSGPWFWTVVAFLAIVAAQLALVRFAGTDIPFHDQWDVEGHWLYPAAHDGTFRLRDAFRPDNENRIAWTLVLDLGLFRWNGDRWDPLVQQFAGAFLRAAAGAGLVWMLGREVGGRGRALVGIAVAVAFLPQLAWHAALWGFETQVYFAVDFALLTFALLLPASRSYRRTTLGLMAGVAGFVAMAPGNLVPPALLGLALVRGLESRDWRVFRRDSWPALLLLVVALGLRVREPSHQTLEPATAAQFCTAAGRALAWPHVSQPWAAMALNAPLIAAVIGRVLRLRRAGSGEDFALLLGFWGVAVALAIGWARGGSPELQFGVPSRYVDFVVLLPIANAWCLFTLTHTIATKRRRVAVGLSAVWGLFLAVGWTGLSAEMLRFVVVPRIEDRNAPVRIAQAFARSRDGAILAGQPRLLVPHSDPHSVVRVLDDPRMHGALPPSLQPGEPLGPLSRFVRWALRR